MLFSVMMDVLKVTALLLLIFETQEECLDKMYEVRDVALKGCTYWTATVPNKFQCESLCWKSVACRSANYNIRNGTCELNHKSTDDNNPGIREEGTLFIVPVYNSDVPHPCRGRPCKENELCALAKMKDRDDFICLPIDIRCPVPDPLPHTIHVPQADTSYKAKFKYTCETGFEFHGEGQEIQCDFPGDWSGPSGECTLVNCSQSTLVSNARVVLQDPGNTTYKAKANYRCDMGFTKLNTTWEVECQGNGSWSFSGGRCEAVDCGQPPTMEHGNYTLTDNGNTTYSATASYSCDTDYEIHGRNMTRCLESGNWSVVANCSHICSLHLGYIFNESLALCYKIVNETKDWNDSRSDCQQEGGDLIILDTEEKNDLMKTIFPYPGDREPYIGGRKQGNKEWYWVDDTPFNYTAWLPGEPRKDGGCLTYKILNSSLSGWNDIWCDHFTQSVCELVFV